MELSGKEIQEKIEKGEKLVIEFYGTWCGPCRILKPIFEKVAKENKTDVQMYFLDVDKNRDLTIKYGVKSIPAIKTFNGATLVETSVGVVSESRINELVKNLLV
jgi:thioredoxin 1